MRLPIVLIGLALSAAPQTALRFTAADVRAHPETAGVSVLNAGWDQQPGVIEARDVSLLQLIETAYRVEGRAVVGGPSWLGTDRFDMAASLPAGAPPAAAQTMLQELLAERFGLRVSHDTRPLPAYALVVAGNGAKLKPATADESGGCSYDFKTPSGTLTCRAAGVAELVQALNRYAAFDYLDRPVHDGTDLTGKYDFTLRWTQRALLGAMASDNSIFAGESLFHALPRQLGLTLVPRPAPSAVLVVEAALRVPLGPARGGIPPLPPAPTEFEAASLRPTDPNAASREGGRQGFMPSGEIRLYGYTIQALLQQTLNRGNPDLIAGLPDWAKRDEYDLDAKTLPGTPVLAEFAMILNLLANRCRLQYHTEQRPVEIYALTLGPGRSRLKAAAASGRSGCHIGAGDGRTTLTCANAGLDQLARSLESAAYDYLPHPVMDLTGLTGHFDLTLSWSVAARTGFQPRPGADEPALIPDSSLTIFQALEKQLGLKLVAEKHPLPVVVVDHIEPPTPN